MNVLNAQWHSMSAYIYLLSLDEGHLGWEYLRRNPAYRNCWIRFSARDCSAAWHWGLKFPENPDLDAREAHPLWIPIPASTVRLAAEEESLLGTRFSLWRLPGRRALIHDGSSIHISCHSPNGSIDLVTVPEFAEGATFSYRVLSGGARNASWQAIERLERLLATPAPRPSHRARLRPTRGALTHLRILQARDGALAGSSHQDIAIALFGAATVQRRWSADGPLRAQVRYFIRRGEQLAARGYRRLAGIDSSAPGGF